MGYTIAFVVSPRNVPKVGLEHGFVLVVQCLLLVGDITKRVSDRDSHLIDTILAKISEIIIAADPFMIQGKSDVTFGRSSKTVSRI